MGSGQPLAVGALPARMRVSTVACVGTGFIFSVGVFETCAVAYSFFWF